MEVVYHENVKHWQDAYNPEVDWHQKWCEKFYTHSQRSMYDFKSMISSMDKPDDYKRELSFMFYMALILNEQRENAAVSTARKLVNCEDNIKNWWVTLNFDPKLFTKEKFDKMIEVLNKKKWYEKYEGVIEFHTDNGHKPHFHMKVITSTNIFKKKNKVIDYLVTIIKDLGTRTSIHCEVWKDYNEAYLAGIKKDVKSGNVEKDETFRDNNNYKQIYVNSHI